MAQHVRVHSALGRISVLLRVGMWVLVCNLLPRHAPNSPPRRATFSNAPQASSLTSATGDGARSSACGAARARGVSKLLPRQAACECRRHVPRSQRRCRLEAKSSLLPLLPPAATRAAGLFSRWPRPCPDLSVGVRLEGQADTLPGRPTHASRGQSTLRAMRCRTTCRVTGQLGQARIRPASGVQ